MFCLFWFLSGVVFSNIVILRAGYEDSSDELTKLAARRLQAENYFALVGWNYINVHCRDNDNGPVDWWVLYKPPSGDEPLWGSGQNFSYITSINQGRWIHSSRYITSNSMLQHTLSPLFRPTYRDYLAVLSYNSKDRKGDGFGSSALGILLADEMGGVWMPHTIKGFPDLTQNRLTVPDSELANGHMVICMSLNLSTLNEIGKMLRDVQAEISGMAVPEGRKAWLPDWLAFETPRHVLNTRAPLRQFEFSTNAKTLRASLMVRPPGDGRCLYQTFAKKKNIVLDVYGHDQNTPTVCEERYSVRNMGAISLKYPETVYYINNNTDRVGFAVSTPGKWTPDGVTPSGYWACTSTLEKEDVSRKGGFIVCFENYNIWRGFDLLKIKEPEC